MKRVVALLVCTFLVICTLTPGTYAESGNINLYEAFSNKDDISKTEVGSRIYKWSMYLPDDAVVYKSDRVNYFSMSTTSYQAGVELEVTKNSKNLALEDILYSIENEAYSDFYWVSGDKEFQIDITKDKNGQRYLQIIEGGGYYDFFSVDNTVDGQFKEYIENRIYIANNNIYKLTVHMNREFYLQHEEMFEKLTSSFKLTFDDKNPLIKELSDSLNTVREYKNTNYGWKMKLSPYWKALGASNARDQVFSPVYSDEELKQNTEESEINKEKDTGYKIPELISVSLIGSALPGENASKWAEKEIKRFNSNYNDAIYDIIYQKEYVQNGYNVYHMSVRDTTMTQSPFISHYLFVVGNGYKYLITAIMADDKYLDKEKMDKFDFMFKSFTLDKSLLSKYIGKIVLSEDMMNLNEDKELAMDKYNFATKVKRSWNTNSGSSSYSSNLFLLLLVDYGMGDYENIKASEPFSNININMSAGSTTESFQEAISLIGESYRESDETRSGIVKVEIQSTEVKDVTIYKINREYDMKAIEKSLKEDNKKSYNFDNLSNEYIYIIKVGKKVYVQSISIPVTNTSADNLRKIDNLWKNTTIDKVNYSSLDLKWRKHSLDEFKSKDKSEKADKSSKDEKSTNNEKSSLDEKTSEDATEEE